MDKNQWRRIKEIFEQASLLDAAEQQAFVEKAAQADSFVITKVLEMLAVNDQPSTSDAHKLTNIVSQQSREVFTSALPLNKGDVVESFSVESCIGEGGMGSVYLAKRLNEEFEQAVAIKVIHKQYTSAQSIQRFKQERKILASLNHKNIASFISGGETQSGLPYIILEYIDGVSITDYCQQHQLDLEARIALFMQVLSAVKYAHQNLIVHRDIKPSNVLVTSDGEVKLLDFGIAKLLQLDEQETQAHSDLTHEAIRVLTPSSASPEQVLGTAVTTRSDVYGLGTLLMHLFTDTPVFDTASRSTHEIEAMIIKNMPAKPSVKCAASDDADVRARSKQLKGDLDTITLHCLQKDPDRRYSSVEQIEEDLGRYQAKYPINARPDSIGYRCKKFIQRNSLASLLTFALVASFVSFSALTLYQAQQIETERDSALEQASVAEETASFMADLFSEARVDNSSGEEVTVVDVLSKAEAKISELDTQASTKSILLLSIAQIYTTLDRFDESLTLLVEARDLLDRFPFKNPETQAEYDLKIDVELGDTKMLQGEYKQAIDMFEQVLTRLDRYAEQNLLNQEKKILRYRAIEYSLGTAYYYVGDNQASARHIASAIEYAEQSESEPVPSIFYITQGGALRDMGEYERSKVALEKSVELERASNEVDSLNLAYALNQLAATLELLGEVEQAIVVAEEGLQIRSQMLGDAHVESISSAGMLSNLHSSLGNYQQAIEIRERILMAMEAENKTDHPYYAITLGSVSTIYKLDGQAQKAQEGLLRAHELLDQFFADGHFEVARPLLHLCEIALSQGELDQAKQYFEQANTILTKELNEDHYLSGFALAMESVIIAADGFESQARELESKALAMFERLYGVDGKRYLQLKESIGKSRVGMAIKGA